MIEKIKISEVKSNPKNPRIIKDEKYKKLLQSIQDFPEMLEKRPLIIDENNVVLWWNMRLKALKELWYKDVYVIRADNRTQDQKNQFIIKDNVWFWEWNQVIILNERDEEKLSERWLDNLNFDAWISQDFDNYENKQRIWNSEIDIDLLEDNAKRATCPKCNHLFIVW